MEAEEPLTSRRDSLVVVEGQMEAEEAVPQGGAKGVPMGRKTCDQYSLSKGARSG
jgi:hypothetical protein